MGNKVGRGSKALLNSIGRIKDGTGNTQITHGSQEKVSALHVCTLSAAKGFCSFNPLREKLSRASQFYLPVRFFLPA